MSNWRNIIIGVLSVQALITSSASAEFVAFESGSVRPLAFTPDGSLLVAANTPDNRLELFRPTDSGLMWVASVPVGLEPVSVAARTNEEVWVVNHLSDSVSIVDLPSRRVVRTILVGDEPRDIVFAGTNRTRAFITTAHRGQHRNHPSIGLVPGAGDPELTTPGIGRADVWVFDPNNLGATVGGTPEKIIVLFSDTPRALAVSNDKSFVYAAAFHSGNQTATVPEGAVCDGFNPAQSCDVSGTEMPGGNPGPETNHAGDPAPEVGLIVRYDRDAQEWRDELDRNWNPAIRFSLPDYDVFTIQADSLEEQPGARFAHVGTTLFNMAVNPVNGAVYVSNTEARNEVRFEGPGEFGGSTVQGRLAQARITVIKEGVVSPRHLNKHIDYSRLPAPPGTQEHSLATPLDMAVSSDGQFLYVAAFGSSRVGVFPTESLENDTFDPTDLSANYIEVSGGGPAGLALDATGSRLYVLTRFDNGLSVVDLQTKQEVSHVTMFNPEPAHVTLGRPMLYDARSTSSNGESSCASCHIFGDLDHLAWDLGDPDEDVTESPIDIKLSIAASAADPPINGTGDVRHFHPMKGPMTTQTLRGLPNSGAQHWRGDRASGLFGTSGYDADVSFRNFVVAFVGLVGGAQPPSDEEMQQFADFALAITLPPNPIRNLDNSLTESQQRGQDFYFGPRLSDGIEDLPNAGFTCNGCHTVDGEKGFFGTNGDQSFENEPQMMKIPHLRNLYQKVGMFGMPEIPFLNPDENGNAHVGDQIRGSGFSSRRQCRHVISFL